ncbi:MAG: TRAP transporter large permease [Burkholderiaceae bacterium]
MTAALTGLAVMFVLSALRVPIAFAMAIVGFFGLAAIRGWNPALASAATLMYETGFSYTLSVVPLFILMGNFVSRAGLSRELFRAAYAFIGHWRGGLAMSTIVACAGFGSICGSSVATAATMSRVAYPSMKEYGYSDSLAAGAIAAGGTLGILIPPSVIMVIYSLMTEVNIGEMFAAGVVPGLVATVFLMLAVAWRTWRDPAAGPPGERTPWPERWRALRGIWGVVVLFAVVMGGIYGGVFTVTEGASIGAFGAFLFALARRALTWPALAQVLVESARTTAMLFAILIGALIFANFVNFTSMPDDLKDAVAAFEVHPLAVIVLICAIYVVLGTAMEELSMILLTVPVLFPLVVHLGFDPIWFGILVVVVVEIGLISPPVGMNLFVLRTLLPQVSTGTLYVGVLPFVVADVVRLAVLIAFPVLSTWLPTVLFR